MCSYAHKCAVGMITSRAVKHPDGLLEKAATEAGGPRADAAVTFTGGRGGARGQGQGAWHPSRRTRRFSDTGWSKPIWSRERERESPVSVILDHLALRRKLITCTGSVAVSFNPTKHALDVGVRPNCTFTNR